MLYGLKKVIMNGPFSILKNKQIEFLVELANHAVDYVVVGGYAMRFHGLDRHAKDLDLLIGYELENAEKLVTVIMRYGRVGPDEIKKRLTKPDVYIPIDGIGVELFTRIKGVDFNTIKLNASETSVDGVKVPVISATDLLESKRAQKGQKILMI